MRGGGSVMAPGFRQDINGLRAWAVFAVVLYHFGVAPFGGGFAGVDVFFVISGYLMYGIVRQDLEAERFSLWQFYLARARRIWPALLVLCLGLLALGWVFLMPEEYQRLGRHVRESLVFTSNLEYFGEAGYFDVASQEKWLLHTWSLSVEWQFYLIFPLLLMLLNRFRLGRAAEMGTLSALLALSYVASGWRATVAPDEAFFLLHTRAWEMLAGALAYQYQARFRLGPSGSRWLEFAGLGLILLAVLGFDKHDLWPGWFAAVPVAGAVLVILAQRQASPWTGIRPMQWLGDVSYSVYLWHWPVVVALSYFQLLDQPLWLAGGIAGSLLLGQLSYRWVEKPSRQHLARLPMRRAFPFLLVLLVVSVVLAQQVRRHGFPDRLPEEVARIEAASNDKNPRSKECLVREDSCQYGNGPLRAIVVGDSHADHLLAGLRANIQVGEGVVQFRGVAACFVMFGAQSNQGGVRCERLSQWLKEHHHELPGGVPLILTGIYSAYTNQSQVSDKPTTFYFDEQVQQFNETYFNQFREHYLAMTCELARLRPVFVVRPTPIMPRNVPQVLGRARLLGQPAPRIASSRQSYQAQHAFILALQDEAAEQCGVRILDPLPLLCDADQCPGERDGVPLYRDTSHLTEHSSRTLAPLFVEVLTHPGE